MLRERRGVARRRVAWAAWSWRAPESRETPGSVAGTKPAPNGRHVFACAACPHSLLTHGRFFADLGKPRTHRVALPAKEKSVAARRNPRVQATARRAGHGR